MKLTAFIILLAVALATGKPVSEEASTAIPTTTDPTTVESTTPLPTTTVAATDLTSPPSTAAPREPIRVVEQVLVLAAPEDVLARDLEEEMLRDEEDSLALEMAEVADVDGEVLVVRPLIAEGRHARCRLIRQSPSNTRYPSRRRQGFQQPFFQQPQRPRPQQRPFRPRPDYLRPVQEEPLQIVF